MKFPFLTYGAELFFLAGTTLLLVFIVLSGSIDHAPINRFYWVEGDTSGIPNAPNTSRWTYWGLIDRDDNSYSVSELSPAYPISPVDNFRTNENVPQSFIDNRDVFYNLSRFAFAFYWITLAFVGALLFGSGAAAFETAVAVMARNAFHDADRYGHIGTKLMAIAWTTVACLIILFFLSWGGFCVASYRRHKERAAVYNTEVAPAPVHDIDVPPQVDEAYPEQQAQQTKPAESGIKFFKIRRHNNDQESV
ncbi:Protein SUR7 [Cyberlindnera jadinii]|uniref:Protein SUR7 n=1 Tax=Cyberlindnera jadinii (strain ATCC 18201 / CBS 1600 / BCRC 20928 / JCM 3617 / NBRC 0987 / NRRL Y-1542) TaxID=983966 RepID=A0A0H5C3W7_CYBJN|nr:Protein SUR7 [Cyberlindnera jadinii]